MWYVYILLCKDGSYYIGSSNDINKRVKEHLGGKGGRYTRSHRPQRLVYQEELATKSKALKREVQLKKWPKARKEALVQRFIMNKNPIGVFDSGIGGISVVREIKKVLPNESIIYLADKANFPYGKKTVEQIRKISEKNVKWLLRRRVKLIVVACNTATVNAISFLRQKFPLVGFVGMEPAVKPAAKKAKKGIIILSSPKATKSKQLHSLIKKYAKGIRVINLGSLELVAAVEEQWNSEKIETLLRKLIPKIFLNQADILVLGCTHFPLIKKQIQKYVGKDVIVVDSGKAVAKRVKVLLEEKRLLSTTIKPIYAHFTTGKREVDIV